MKLTRKQRLLEQLDQEANQLQLLKSKTTVASWSTDEVAFEKSRESVTGIIEKIYKGNASKKVKAFDDAIDNQSAVVYSLLPNGNRDPRNHGTIFKPKITAAIKMLQGFRRDLKTKHLWQLRETRRRKFIAVGGGIITLLTIVKLALEIVNMLRKS